MLDDAFAYLRVSSDPQKELSIPQQKNEIERHFDRKYNITEWFEERDGVSASKKQTYRNEFEKMLFRIKEVKAICCYSLSRFTRFDSIDAGQYAAKLRLNNIHIDTVREGEIDLATEQGKMVWFMHTEFHSRYPKELSGNSVRGRNSILESGYWVAGAVPYGYNRKYIEGDKTRIVLRSERSNKGRHERCRLIINDEEARIVKLIFQYFLVDKLPLREIARRLNDDGVPSPSASRYFAKNAPINQVWTHLAVTDILKNHVYAGWIGLGFSRQRSKEAFNRTNQNRVLCADMVIVDQPTFDLVQRKI